MGDRRKRTNSSLNDPLPRPDPERDKEPGLCLQAAVSESAQTEYGLEGRCDSALRTHETKHRGDGEGMCIGHTEKEGLLCDMWLILTTIFPQIRYAMCSRLCW